MPAYRTNTVNGITYEFRMDDSYENIAECLQQDPPYQYLIENKIPINTMIKEGKIRKENGSFIFPKDFFYKDANYVRNNWDAYMASITNVEKLIDTGRIYKNEEDEIIFDVDMESVGKEYVKQHFAETIKQRVSLDELGIVLENVEVVCADPVKIIAHKSSNVTGDNLDIVL